MRLSTMPPCTWNAKQQSQSLRHEAALSPLCPLARWLHESKEPSCFREHLPPAPAPQPVTRKEEPWQIAVPKSRSGVFLHSFGSQHHSAPDPVCSPGVAASSAFVPYLLRVKCSEAQAQAGYSHNGGPDPSGGLGCQINFPLTKKKAYYCSSEKSLGEAWPPCVSWPVCCSLADLEPLSRRAEVWTWGQQQPGHSGTRHREGLGISGWRAPRDTQRSAVGALTAHMNVLKPLGKPSFS